MVQRGRGMKNDSGLRHYENTRDCPEFCENWEAKRFRPDRFPSSEGWRFRLFQPSFFHFCGAKMKKRHSKLFIKEMRVRGEAKETFCRPSASLYRAGFARLDRKFFRFPRVCRPSKSLSLNKRNRPDLRRNAIRSSAKIADNSSIV